MSRRLVALSCFSFGLMLMCLFMAQAEAGNGSGRDFRLRSHGMAGAAIRTTQPYQVTDNSLNDLNVSAAVDSSGAPHVVYERNGMICYRCGLGPEEVISAGSSPVIAMGTDDVPRVAYINGPAKVAMRQGGAWAASLIISPFDAGWVSIDLDASNNVHAVLAANTDGDSYSEIYYSNNVGGSFAVPSLLADGYYDSGQGNYFHSPGIAVDSEGYYHIVCLCQNWGGRVSWSSESIQVWTNKPNASTLSTDGQAWSSCGLGRNAISMDGSGNLRIVYTISGQVHHALVNSSWNDVTVTTGGGAQPSVSSMGASTLVAYVDSSTGNVNTIQDSGSGFGAPLVLGAGHDPVAAAGPALATYAYVLQSDGTDDEIYLYSSQSLASPTVVSTSPLSVTICGGYDTTLSVVATGTNLHYQWYNSAAPLESNPVGTDSATFTTPALSSSQEYWVKVTGDGGVANSSTATVTVNLAASVTKSPASITICRHHDTVLSVEAGGSGTIHYAWYQGAKGDTSTPAPGATDSPTYTTPLLAVATSFWVQVSNDCGSADSDAALVEVDTSCYDMNRDGALDAKDSLLLATLLAGGIQNLPGGLASGDINGDGVLDAQDLLLEIREILAL